MNKSLRTHRHRTETYFHSGPDHPQRGVVADLEARGVHVIAEADLDSPDDTLQNGTVVIRSHGVGKPIYDKLKEKTSPT